MALAAALLLAAAAALVLAAGSRSGEDALLARDADGVVVLDVSASMTVETYRQIGVVLRQAAASGGRYGLVMFSDTAYEALPPGTRASELLAYARFFEPVPRDRRRAVEGQVTIGGTAFPANPWGRAFTAGTRISTGLRLAQEVLERERVEGSGVVLVSDLATDQSDIPALGRALVDFGRRGISLRVVALAATPANRAFFRQMLARGTLVDAPPPGASRSDGPAWRAGVAFPAALVGACGALLALLAANELWSARLTWARPRAEGG